MLDRSARQQIPGTVSEVGCIARNGDLHLANCSDTDRNVKWVSRGKRLRSCSRCCATWHRLRRPPLPLRERDGLQLRTRMAAGTGIELAQSFPAHPAV